MSDEKKDAVKHDAEEKKEEKEEKKDTAKADAAATKADAEAGEKIDKILTCLDSFTSKLDALGSRMDAYESKKDGAEAAMMSDKKKKDAEKAEEEEGKSEKLPFTKDSKKKDAEEEVEEKGDPKELKADKKKDAEEKEEKEEKEKEKKDAARMDGELKYNELKKQLDAFEARSRQLSDDAVSDAQAKADTIFSAFGDSAPRPMQNELPIEYRRRVATKLRTHSPQFKDEDIKVLAMNPKVFQIAEDQIYKDAWAALADLCHPRPNPGQKKPHGRLRVRGYVRGRWRCPKHGSRLRILSGSKTATWISNYSDSFNRIAFVAKSVAGMALRVASSSRTPVMRGATMGASQ